MSGLAYFGGDDQIASLPTKFLDCLPHDYLGLSSGIAGSVSVLGVHAILDVCMHG